ncbi:defense protein l(2)34Fc-like [Lucilia sericata]|uniref:defense protein l(2)34Fc-like n=1 Tax=Lucilia sericata TaxID=13632 RepID=UPI0018A83804|nr:defense protein l(2)34Fc-like [Lucilia sericata]
MFRFMVIALCLAVPVLGNSAGAPAAICKNGLTPEHHVEPQSSQVPYSFSGGNSVKAGDKITLTLGGGEFLGFALQAQDAKEHPVGTFKVIETNKSQLLTCSAAGDTLTHVQLNSKPITSVEFQWIAPADYSGAVKFVGTVAKNGGTYWIRKVIKEVTVQ